MFRALILAALLALWSPAGAQVPSAPAPAPDAADTAALECLTSAIYHEAAREPQDGQRAVARVILNRLASPAFPKSLCAVVYEGAQRTTGCQFSFTCDGALGRRIDGARWLAAALVAKDALAHPDALPGLAALHYHADYVRPRWAGDYAEEARIGRHIFYAGPHGRARTPAAPARAVRTATFTVWGLDVARVERSGNGNGNGDGVSVAAIAPAG